MNALITPQTLPLGLCPSTLQEMWNAFAAYGYVTIPDALSQIVWQASKPTDTSLSWGKVDSLGRPIRIYRFAQGAWLSLHPTASGLTMWWFDVLPANASFAPDGSHALAWTGLTAFDGGDTSLLSDTTGPMWQVATDYNGNTIAAAFPIPAGTLPSSTVLNLGDTGGEENHSLVATEMPPHTHTVATSKSAQAGQDNSGAPVPNSNYNNIGPWPSSVATDSQGGVGTPPVVVAHNNMPLYVVGYLLQRTARIWYAEP
jgi:microcystin-dependent protein